MIARRHGAGDQAAGRAGFNSRSRAGQPSGGDAAPPPEPSPTRSPDKRNPDKRNRRRAPVMEVRNVELEAHRLGIRLGVAMALVVVCFSILFARFYHLQVVR